MKTSTHISRETLADLAEDRAAPDVQTTAIAHVSACSTCDATLRRLRGLILTMKSDDSEDAPRDVLLSAINLRKREKRSVLPRIVATLVFDSRSASPAFGMRSLRTTSRQMLFSAQDTDVDLRVAVQNDECTVTGQIIRDGCASGVVEISGATGSAETTLNELCEFALPTVPVGNYSLRIRMADVEIEIPELELKD